MTCRQHTVKIVCVATVAQAMQQACLLLRKIQRIEFHAIFSAVTSPVRVATYEIFTARWQYDSFLITIASRKLLL